MCLGKDVVAVEEEEDSNEEDADASCLVVQ